MTREDPPAVPDGAAPPPTEAPRVTAVDLAAITEDDVDRAIELAAANRVHSAYAAGSLPIGEELAELLADNAVGLFLEYRDAHGYSEDDARRAAVRDVVEGATTELEQRPPLDAASLRALAKRAITDRLGYWQASAIRTVIADDDGTLEIRLDSISNWHAVAAAVGSAGYRYEGNPAHGDLSITIAPPADPEP